MSIWSSAHQLHNADEAVGGVEFFDVAFTRIDRDYDARVSLEDRDGCELTAYLTHRHVVDLFVAIGDHLTRRAHELPYSSDLETQTTRRMLRTLAERLRR